jgi:hypothetical protein
VQLEVVVVTEVVRHPLGRGVVATAVRLQEGQVGQLAVRVGRVLRGGWAWNRAEQIDFVTLWLLRASIGFRQFKNKIPSGGRRWSCKL